MSRLPFLALLIFSRLPAAYAEDPPAATPPPAGEVQYVCEADIYYSWRRLPPADSSGTNPVVDEAMKPIEVFFRKAHARASVKGDAETSLQALTLEFQALARKQCETDHQSQGSCSASRMLALGPEYRNLDFESRRLVREQVASDCAKNTGICTETRATEMECREAKAIETAEEKPTEAPKKDAKKK